MKKSNWKSILSKSRNLQWFLFFDFLAVLLLGWLFLFIRDFIPLSKQSLEIAVLLMAASKFGVFIFRSIRKVKEHLSHTNFSVAHCLIAFSSLGLLFVTSFALDFYFLESVNSQSFLNHGIRFTLGEGCYFSIITFASIGYGDIVPQAWIAKVTVGMEVGISYIYNVFLIALLISGKTYSGNTQIPE